MKRTTNLVAAAAGTALGLAVPAAATPSSGFSTEQLAKGVYDKMDLNADKDGKWDLKLRTKDVSDVYNVRNTITPGGYSGWHAHPGPVFVTVVSGSITWTNGSDPLCGSHTYSAGQSFVEEPYVVHNAANASMSQGAEFIAITIKPAGFVGPAFRLDRPQPNNCGF